MVLQTHDPERRMSKVESTAEIVVHCFAFEKASGQTPLLGTGMHRLQSKQSSKFISCFFLSFLFLWSHVYLWINIYLFFFFPKSYLSANVVPCIAIFISRGHQFLQNLTLCFSSPKDFMEWRSTPLSLFLRGNMVTFVICCFLSYQVPTLLLWTCIIHWDAVKF